MQAAPAAGGGVGGGGVNQITFQETFLNAPDLIPEFHPNMASDMFQQQQQQQSRGDYNEMRNRDGAFGAPSTKPHNPLMLFSDLQDFQTSLSLFVQKECFKVPSDHVSAFANVKSNLNLHFRVYLLIYVFFIAMCFVFGHKGMLLFSIIWIGIIFALYMFPSKTFNVMNQELSHNQALAYVLILIYCLIILFSGHFMHFIHAALLLLIVLMPHSVTFHSELAPNQPQI